MSERAAIIGAGANELVAAHLLSRAGWKVVVLDSRAEDDPSTTTLGWVVPHIARELDLGRHGLQSMHADPWITVPVDGAARLDLWRDATRSAESIRRFSPADAARWPVFCERMAIVARALEALVSTAPPDPLADGIGELTGLAGLALRLRRLGRQGIEDLLRFVPMPIADLLDDWFECDALKGALGAAGILHLQQGPRSGGTALNFLHQQLGGPGGVFRAPRSNVEEVLASLPGIEIRRSVRVARISVRAHRVTGVALASGEEIAAPLVLCGADPRRTLLELLEPGWLEPEAVRAVRRIRSRGVVAQVLLELDREPGFTTLAVAPSLDDLERAYDDAKYGRISRAPYLEASAGGKSVRVHVQYAPYALADGTWDEVQRDRLVDLVVRALDRSVPGLSKTVVSRRALAPPDLEARFGWPQGQMHHAELALDQWLWMRPIPELARYRTPISGLYLCGAATHPGAFVPGSSGYHAARQALKDARDPPREISSRISRGK